MSNREQAVKNRLSPKLITGILVVLFFAVALYLRAYLPYDKVFTGDWIKLTGADAYYHMRVVDNLVHNFPHLFSFDPYFIYPNGIGVNIVHFFDWLLSGIIWVIGLGSPTQHTIDMVSVYYPPVLGALTVIPVYFIGKELFGRWAGVLSASLIALLPGEFLGRSILGFTDHHVAETLFTTLTMLFLILAIKTASRRQLTFSHLKRRDWATSAKPIIYGLLAGIFLGIYILTFIGAILFIFIIFSYFVIQMIINHLKGKSTNYLCLVGVVLFFVPLVVSVLIFSDKLLLVSVIIALLTLPVLNGVSRLIASKKIKSAYYPLTLIGLGLAGLGLLHLINPSLLGSMLRAFRVFVPIGVQLTTIEMQPLLFPQGSFTFTIAWGNFTTSFFLSIISFFIILIYFVIKHGDAEKGILLVWSLVILVATLGQRRFGYYFAVNVALLTGYLSVLVYYIIRFIFDYLRGESTNYMSKQTLMLAGSEGIAAKSTGVPQEREYYEILGVTRRATVKQIRKAFRELTSKYHADPEHTEGDEAKFNEINEAYKILNDPRKRTTYDRSRYRMEERKKTKPKKRYLSGLPITIRHVTIAFSVIVIFFLILYPNIKPAVTTASQARFAPSDGWVSSLSWMRENTPEPFGDPDLYYQLEENYTYRSLYWLERNIPNPSGDPVFYSQLEGNYEYPESAYGVIAWWDYGYWITRIAHRIPVANPSQAAGPVTTIANLFTSQDEKAASEIIQELNSPYIIIDYETAVGKFWAIASWAGQEHTEFFDVYHVPREDRLEPIQLFHAEYYRSLSTRLYNFDGKAVTPESTLVISYQEKVSQEGTPYKEITSAEQFDDYEEAEAYLLSQESNNYKIVSADPTSSPIPLEELRHYTLIHGSDMLVKLSETWTGPAVKIFEYAD
ncbi:oligosaccharyl transferase, archaeosortase A system-associated [Chloroflexota bacterium]